MAREVKLSKLRNRLEYLKSLIKITRSRCERIQELYDTGLVSEVELLRSKVKLLEEEQELQYLMQQIELLSPPGL